jgi:ribosomal protein L7/L12
MPRSKTLTVLVDGILILAIVIASLDGGRRLLLLLLIPWLIWDVVRVHRPSTPRVNAQFTEPGNHRVVLQVPGPRPILVIREIRRTTGLDLVAAKRIIDDWPAIVVHSVSESSAERVAERLRQAGAKAIATPAEENL